MAELTSLPHNAEILKDLISILEEYKYFDKDPSLPVINFQHPNELKNSICATLPENGSSLDEIHDALRKIIHYSVRTGSPHFHNQLYAGVDEYGLAGAWLTEALNTSQYTYEVAPVFTLLEREVIKKTLELVGYPEMPEGDGILSPGGSLSNMYGMVVARFSRFPEIKRKGLSGLPPLAIFTSEDGHYSVTKGAHWLGFGTDNVFKIKSNELGQMDVRDLKQVIGEVRKSGHVPFYVNATSGTTVLGAFDPLAEIAAVCQEENVWLHVDACLGGTLLLSEKHREQLKGIELSNSVAWNPHKLLGAPFQCSLFLTKGKNILHETNCAGAKYLFQKDKFYDVSWDTGDKSIQCGRKTDGMKFWLMWKARGSEGLRRSVDVAMDCAEYFFNLIKNREGYKLVLPKFECTNICFWYIPPSLRGQEENEEWRQKLHRVAPTIKERMIMKGSLMIGYTPMNHKGYVNFFRMVVSCQPPPSKSSMDFVINEIEKFGADL